MPSYVTPKKNAEYIFYVSLVSQANTKTFQTNPTLAAGDVKVSTDGGTEANITTLPVVTPAGSKRVKVTVSTTEMNGDNVQVAFSDAAGDEWCDLTANIQTTANQIDDLMPLLVQRTTIATLASQTSFTLTAGSADDGAYGDNGAHMMTCIITDQTTGVQKCAGTISNYTGATKTVTLVRDPGVFTIAAGDYIDILAVATASAVADEKYTGTNHNVIDSLARRVRNIIEFGSYDGGCVFIDTVNGAAGTTDYESGTIYNPVDSDADAHTIGTSLNLKCRNVAAGSSITLAASRDGLGYRGYNWTLALGGQSISTAVIEGATVSGVCTGASPPEFKECDVGNVTVPPSTFTRCDIGGTITLPVGDVHLHRCNGDASAALDFGASVANTTVFATNFSGTLTVSNLGASGTDTLNLRGHGKIVLDASCVGGTINWDGHFGITNNGSGITINKDDITIDVAAIKAKTDSLTFTVAGEVDSNVQSVNDVTITGDGSTTPFNV